ncbi:MAG: amidohydrolase, partial [Cytophagaceae bacterium]
FYFLGGMTKGRKVADAAPHHTPDFQIDESCFTLGVRSLCHLTVDYMEQKSKK